MSRAIDAGRAMVTLGIKNNLDKGLKRAQRSLNSFGNKSKAVGAKLAGAGAAMAAPLGVAALKFMQFDDAIRMTGAVSQSTGTAAFDSLREKALELGRTTSFTATDVASLMTELARANFKPEQIEQMTGSILNLSKATGTDATMSAEILSKTLNQFGMNAGEAARVADTLAAGANMSMNTVEGLGEAMRYGGTTAADLGYSLEETVAIFGTLGNVGIQGSMAGTTLKRLTTLSAAEAGKLSKIFGVNFLDAAGNARPLVDTLGEVAEATNELPSGERAKKFNEAFGLLGITGASAIAKNAASTKDLLKQLKDAGGIAEKTATEMEAGLGGSFRKLLSAAEGLVLAIGGAVAPAFQFLADVVTMATGPITEWIQENEWLVKTVAAVAGGLLAAGAALIGFGFMFNLLAAGVGGVVAVLGIVGTTLGALLSPIGIAIGGMAALAVWFWKYSDQARAAINWLKDTFKPLVDTVGNAMSAIKTLIGEGKIAEAWSLATDTMMFAWLWLTNGIRDAWTDTVNWVFDMGSALAIGIGSIFEALGGAIKSMLDGYAAYYDMVYNAVTEQLGELTGVKTIGGYGNQSAFDDTFGKMKGTIEDAADTIEGFGSSMSDAAEADMERRAAEAEAEKKARADDLEKRRKDIMTRSSAVDEFKTVSDAELEQKEENAKAAEDEQKAREKQLEEVKGAAGPNATFDAFAASIIGMGPRFENESLKAQKETAKNTGIIAKKKPAVAEFAE